MTEDVQQSIDETQPESATQQPPVAARRKPGILEALVSLSIMVSIAGITVPIVGGELAEGRVDTAYADMQHILDGIRGYSNDTLFLPTGNRGRTNVSWLYGPGELPDGGALGAVSSSRPVEDVLQNDSMGGPGWQGPYGEAVEDPWGHAYIANLEGLVDTRLPAWILSAGPDGVVQTSAGDMKPRGDDLLLPIN